LILLVFGKFEFFFSKSFFPTFFYVKIWRCEYGMPVKPIAKDGPHISRMSSYYDKILLYFVIIVCCWISIQCEQGFTSFMFGGFISKKHLSTLMFGVHGSMCNFICFNSVGHPFNIAWQECKIKTQELLWS
jgi:hypothetical protein